MTRSGGSGASGGLTVFAMNLDWALEDHEIEDMFARYGEVSGYQVVSHTAKRFAFVHFARKADAERAISALNCSFWNGRILFVSKAKPNHNLERFLANLQEQQALRRRMKRERSQRATSAAEHNRVVVLGMPFEATPKDLRAWLFDRMPDLPTDTFYDVWVCNGHKQHRSMRPCRSVMQAAARFAITC
ncbi:unnamed protein product (mitochondrion) [Plasmodiophora brassicae]|uniref:RRM domain-containing protein n=1 Tax=Plasmodiophora brassicae TaxID=37360 RepID=A0A3P3Y8U3_PLABS|nr:unnamed protein product [Plasmodiophora brassicae]